jgi:hypothetical protein
MFLPSADYEVVTEGPEITFCPTPLPDFIEIHNKFFADLLTTF